MDFDVLEDSLKDASCATAQCESEGASRTTVRCELEGASSARARCADRWRAVSKTLRNELGEDVFTSWFGRLELDRLDGATATLSVPTKFLKSWIQAHYMGRLLAAVQSQFSGVAQIALEVRSSTRAIARTAHSGDGLRSTPIDGLVREPPAPASSPSTKGLREEPQFKGWPVDSRFTFESFIVGPANELAHAALSRISWHEGAAIYAPFYLHGAVGRGKTHLLQATAQAAMKSHRRVVYLTAEKFMYGFVQSLKDMSVAAFQEQMRSVDLLLIDDIQFLQGRSVHREFCGTLSALLETRGQIVLAADRPPSELEALDERTRSRLGGGLCLEMGFLDEDLRLQLLEMRIASARALRPGFNVPRDVIAYVASAIESNGRDLDGAVNRLIAHESLIGEPLTIERAEMAIRDLVRTREPKRVKIEDIQKLLATHFNISRADILSHRRTANVVRPRQIGMYLAKLLTLRSLPEIGRRFGGRDHTTVLHAVRKMEALSETDSSLREDIALLKRMLQD